MVTGYRWLSGAGHTTQELPNLRSKCKHVQEANLALGARFHVGFEVSTDSGLFHQETGQAREAENELTLQ